MWLTWESFLLNLNAAACCMISVRMLAIRVYSRLPIGIRLVRYALILSPAWTAFNIWSNVYTSIDYGDLFVNLLLVIGVWRFNGDITKIASTR